MISLKPIEEIPEKQKSEEEIKPDMESELGVQTKKKLIKPKKPTAELQEADEKEITEETIVTVTEEIIEIPEDVEMVDKEKPKKKKLIRQKSKPDEET
ncbi:hypothetical protein BLA29_014669, partial [Euroglyphus maynei]